MICAYDEIYLERARDVLAVMFDYAVNSLKIEGDKYYKMFAGSSVCRQFECGNPSYVAGASGIELAHTVLDEIGLDKNICKYQSVQRSPEYWAGWAIGYYQWEEDEGFAQIGQLLSFADIVRMYQKYHELDIRHFCDHLNKIKAEKQLETKLKTIRRLAGYSQSMLARRSGVPLRTIQQYEQRQKNINKAQAEAVLSLARALGCQSRDLME